jgi:hypothetical protein
MLDASQNTMIIAYNLLKEYDTCHFATSSKHLSREVSVSTRLWTSHTSRNMADVRPPENVIMLNEVSYGTDKTSETYRTESKNIWYIKRYDQAKSIESFCDIPPHTWRYTGLKIMDRVQCSTYSFKVIKRSSSSDMVQKGTQVIPFSFCRARIHHPANLCSLLSSKPFFLHSIPSIIFWKFSIQETMRKWVNTIHSKVLGQHGLLLLLMVDNIT